MALPAFERNLANQFFADIVFRARSMHFLLLFALSLFLLSCGDGEDLDVDTDATGYSTACRGSADFDELSDKDWYISINGKKPTDSSEYIELNFNPVGPFLNVTYKCSATRDGSLRSQEAYKASGFSVNQKTFLLSGPIEFAVKIPQTNAFCNRVFQGAWAFSFSGSCLKLEQGSEKYYFQAK